MVFSLNIYLYYLKCNNNINLIMVIIKIRMVTLRLCYRHYKVNYQIKKIIINQKYKIIKVKQLL